MKTVGLCITLALAISACAPVAEITSTQDGCRARLNRGWLTEQAISGYRGTCNPDGTVTLEVDQHAQRTQTDALSAVAEGAARGAASGMNPAAGLTN